MKIFTDASLNDAKKTAGFSCICVDDNNQSVKQGGFSFITRSVHFTELFAVRCAVQLAVEEKYDDVKIFSDSSAVLKKLQDYIQCLSKTTSTLSQRDRRFLSKLESERVPFQKRILDDIVDVFEKNKNIKFTFFHVHGHQRPKEPLITEEDFNAFWNCEADKVADEIRLYGECGILDAGRLDFLNDGKAHPVKLVGDKPMLFANVNIFPFAGIKEPQVSKKKEDHTMRVAHHARRNQCCGGVQGGRGSRV